MPDELKPLTMPEFVQMVADLNLNTNESQWEVIIGKAVKLCMPDENGDDAEPLAKEVIERAIRFIQVIREVGCVPPSVVYTEPTGNVCFDWNRKSATVNVELYPDAAEVMRSAPSVCSLWSGLKWET